MPKSCANFKFSENSGGGNFESEDLARNRLGDNSNFSVLGEVIACHFRCQCVPTMIKNLFFSLHMNLLCIALPQTI